LISGGGGGRSDNPNSSTNAGTLIDHSRVFDSIVALLSAATFVRRVAKDFKVVENSVTMAFKRGAVSPECLCPATNFVVIQPEQEVLSS
jgi:predicted MarR family transcription regulator